MAFNEIGVKDWKNYIERDDRFVRPAEVDLLIGDASKAKKKLGWQPEVQFKELVKMMVNEDLLNESKKLKK